ncbi:MAG: DUF3501 family protein [Gammaproteobacteria bacterium]|nr:MAG: DUF3501 family protein [Gammaproteobacteria bacterium]UCH41931.1 MAG: DUF3501 family protein [Gammaproteobacteria bacterium]
MSQPITRDDLMSLEQYAEKRGEFRQQVLEHKKYRQVPLGPNATLYFEDRLTLLYQIQEMLRIEKVFEADGINEELEAYNPLIPSGRNFKATFMIEYPNPLVRAAQLEKMVGIEDLVWIQIGSHDKIWAIADEDLERSTESKTSAVHFLRFEISDEMAQELKDGAELRAGVQHPVYSYALSIEDETRASLLKDLD